MKKNIFAIGLLLFLAVNNLLAQSANYNGVRGTTLEEYNYMSKGYKIQSESGLDMKKGYRFKDLDPHYVELTNEKGQSYQRKIEVRLLIREGEVKPCGILLIYKRTDNGVTIYLGVPNRNSPKEIWSKYSEDFSAELMTTDKDPKGIGYAVMWCLSKTLSDAIDVQY